MQNTWTVSKIAKPVGYKDYVNMVGQRPTQGRTWKRGHDGEGKRGVPECWTPQSLPFANKWSVGQRIRVRGRHTGEKLQEPGHNAWFVVVGKTKNYTNKSNGKYSLDILALSCRRVIIFITVTAGHDDWTPRTWRRFWVDGQEKKKSKIYRPDECRIDGHAAIVLGAVRDENERERRRRTEHGGQKRSVWTQRNEPNGRYGAGGGSPAAQQWEHTAAESSFVI